MTIIAHGKVSAASTGITLLPGRETRDAGAGSCQKLLEVLQLLRQIGSKGETVARADISENVFDL